MEFIKNSQCQHYDKTLNEFVETDYKPKSLWDQIIILIDTSGSTINHGQSKHRKSSMFYYG